MLVIGDVRSSPPVVVPGELSLRGCLEVLQEQAVKHLVVVGEGGRHGLLHHYQLYRYCRRSRGTLTVRGAHAARPARELAVTASVVSPGDRVVDALGVLATGWEDAVVVSERAHPVAVFTLEDALALATGWMTPWWKVGQAMTRVRWGLPGSTPVRRALRLLWNDRRPYTLVCDGPRVTNALSLRQLVAVDPQQRAVLDDLRWEGSVLSVSEETRLLDGASILHRLGRHCVPVTSEGRRPAGVFTVNDVLRALGRTMKVAEVHAS